MKSAIGIVIAIENVPQGEVGERVHDDEREDREEDDHDREDGEERGDAADRADLLPRHLAEALAVPAHGEEEDDHVLDGAREDDADDDPDRPGQEAHLRREDGPDERAGAGDRREVMAEEDAPIGDVVVDPVVETLGRSRAVVVRAKDALDDEAGVEAVGDRVGAESGEDEPDRVDLLAARERDEAPGNRAEDRDGAPDEHLSKVHARHFAPPETGSAGCRPKTERNPKSAGRLDVKCRRPNRRRQSTSMS